MAKKNRKKTKWQETQREDVDKNKVSLGDMFKGLAAEHPDLTLEGTGQDYIEPRETDAPVDAGNEITRDSGKQGILAWVNKCMNLISEEAVQEDHPMIESLVKWVEAQYVNGRNDPITEEEMIRQMSAVSINQASKYFGVGTHAIESWIDKHRIEVKLLWDWPIVSLHLQNSRSKSKNAIKLWHGTTAGLAKDIVKRGFKRSEARFTRKLPEARNLAIKKAKQRDDTPVVMACEIDLEKYRSFGKSGPNTYTFYIPSGEGSVDGVVVGKEVVLDVSVVVAETSGKRG